MTNPWLHQLYGNQRKFQSVYIYIYTHKLCIGPKSLCYIYYCSSTHCSFVCDLIQIDKLPYILYPGGGWLWLIGHKIRNPAWNVCSFYVISALLVLCHELLHKCTVTWRQSAGGTGCFEGASSLFVFLGVPQISSSKIELNPYKEGANSTVSNKA